MTILEWLFLSALISATLLATWWADLAPAPFEHVDLEQCYPDCPCGRWWRR